MRIGGYVLDQTGAGLPGATVQVYTAVAGVLTDTPAVDANGYWRSIELDPGVYKTKVTYGLKVIWLDGRSEIQVTRIDAASLITTDTINEHTATAGVTVDGVLLKDNFIAIAAVPALKGRITSGNYTGDGTANKAIAHGLGVTPKIVFLTLSPAGGFWYRIFGALAGIYYDQPGAQGFLPVTIPDATNFYVGNVAGYPHSANGDAIAYYWVAMG